MTHTITVVYKADDKDDADMFYEMFSKAAKDTSTSTNKAKVEACYQGDAMAERDELRELLQEFCDRVDRGEVRSKTTYAKFKAALTK